MFPATVAVTRNSVSGLLPIPDDVAVNGENLRCRRLSRERDEFTGKRRINRLRVDISPLSTRINIWFGMILKLI